MRDLIETKWRTFCKTISRDYQKQDRTDFVLQYVFFPMLMVAVGCFIVYCAVTVAWILIVHALVPTLVFVFCAAIFFFCIRLIYRLLIAKGNMYREEDNDFYKP